MARSFNGSSDFIAATNFGPTNFDAANTFSGSAWINQTTSPTTVQAAYITNLSAGPAFIGWFFGNGGITGAGQIDLLLRHDNATNNLLNVVSSTTTSLVNNGAWNQVGFTYNGNSLASGVKLYINGNQTSVSVVTDNLSATIKSSLVADIGSAIAGTAAPLKGSMSDVAVWNAVLTAGEMAALGVGARPYNIRPSALVSYWPLDGIQSTEPDLSGNVNNGILTGTALAFGPPMMQFTPRWPQNSLSVATTASFQPAWAIRTRIVVDGIGI